MDIRQVFRCYYGAIAALLKTLSRYLDVRILHVDIRQVFRCSYGAIAALLKTLSRYLDVRIRQMGCQGANETLDASACAYRLLIHLQLKAHTLAVA